MKRITWFLLALAVCVCAVCLACAETVKVAGDDRVDLCASANGKTVARIFRGTPAERLEQSGKWSKVRIGGNPVSVTGWILSASLEPVAAGEELYIGEDCMPADGCYAIRLTGKRDNKAQTLDMWDALGDDVVSVAGIFSDNEWLLVARISEAMETEWFYTPAATAASFETLHVRSRAPDSVVSLRAEPNTKAKVLVSCFGGVPASVLYSFDLSDEWSRICIGGVAGYMMNEFLEDYGYEIPPYRPPLSPLAREEVPLYAEMTGKTQYPESDVLGEYELFSVLGRSKYRYLVRICTNEPGEYRYGWIEHKDLRKEDLCGGSTKATVLRDTLVFDWDGQRSGSLQAGQEVTVRWFYSEFPSDDFALWTEYRDPNESAWVWVDADQITDPVTDEDWMGGIIPVDTLDIDNNLVFPVPAG